MKNVLIQIVVGCFMVTGLQAKETINVWNEGQHYATKADSITFNVSAGDSVVSVPALQKKVEELEKRIAELEALVPNKYAVSYYDYEGGTIIETDSIYLGKSSILPSNPTREGYAFMGWSDTADVVIGDMDIYGLWRDSANYGLGTSWQTHAKATDENTTDEGIVNELALRPYVGNSSEAMWEDYTDIKYPNAYNEDKDAYTFTDAEIQELIPRYYVPKGFTVYKSIMGEGWVVVVPKDAKVTMQTWNVNRNDYVTDTSVYSCIGTKYAVYTSDAEVDCRIIIE